MRTNLRDWTSVASGRVPSVATIVAAEPLGWRRRVAARLMVHRGVLPEDRPSRAYATALARDLDRMRPRGHESNRWLGLAVWPLLMVTSTLNSHWLFVGVAAVCGIVLAGMAYVQRNDRHALRTVVIAGYDQLSKPEQIAFNTQVREPLALTTRERMTGHAIYTLAVSGWGAVIGVAIQWRHAEPVEWVLVAVLVAVCATVLPWTANRTRRRFMRELLGEPRPPLPVQPALDSGGVGKDHPQARNISEGTVS